jgi:hypothetical protein
VALMRASEGAISYSDTRNMSIAEQLTLLYAFNGEQGE